MGRAVVSRWGADREPCLADDSPDCPLCEPLRDARVDEDGDRISVTDVNGTVARFEMTYEPPGEGERVKFGPPLRSRIPSALYLVASIVFGIVTLYAYNAPTSSKLFVWAVEGDRIRPLSVSVIAVILLVSSAATVLRTHMRGVIVTDDWIEARYLLPLGIPRARRWGWPAGDPRRARRAPRGLRAVSTAASSACPTWPTVRVW